MESNSKVDDSCTWKKWFPYLVRWHFKAVKGKIHCIMTKGFTNLDEAKAYYDNVSTQYAKKIITPLTVEHYSPTWAQYIPGGSLIEPYMVSYYIATKDDVVETYVKYFSEEKEAEEFYNNEVAEGTAKKLTTPYNVITNDGNLAVVLP
jgi:hypothetical protein